MASFEVEVDAKQDILVVTLNGQDGPDARRVLRHVTDAARACGVPFRLAIAGAERAGDAVRSSNRV